MPFIIGQSSTITINGKGTDFAGIISFSFNDGKSFNPLYQLTNLGTASSTVYAIDVQENPTVNFSVYSGYDTVVNSPVFTGGDLDVPDCVNSAMSIAVDFVPGLCPVPGGGGSPFLVNDTFYVNSYSFSKDISGFGQESWSAQGLPASHFIIPNSPTSFSDVTSAAAETAATTVILLNGIPTGNVSGDFSFTHASGILTPESGDAGIVLFASDDIRINQVNSDVSAGALSLGNANITYNGFVSSFGGSTLFRKDGVAINASVSIPISPIYL